MQRSNKTFVASTDNWQMSSVVFCDCRQLMWHAKSLKLSWTFVDISDGSSHRLIFDRSLQVKQLNVVEPHGIMLLRGGHSNKEGKIYVFRLSQIESLNEPRCRLDIKDHRLERTRGTNLYAISRPGKTKTIILGVRWTKLPKLALWFNFKAKLKTGLHIFDFLKARRYLQINTFECRKLVLEALWMEQVLIEIQIPLCVTLRWFVIGPLNSTLTVSTPLQDSAFFAY